MKKNKSLLPLACLLMINCFLMWCPAKAQTMAFQDHRLDKPGNYQQSEKNLSTILTGLEKKYKVSFSFDLKTIRDKKVSTDEKKKFSSLDAELNYLLPPLQLLFEKLDAKLYLILPEKKQQPAIPVKSPAGTSSASFYENAGLEANTQKVLHAAIDAASINLTGTVTSASGEPLQKVSVLLKGTALGTATDKDGNYALNVPDGKGTLQFSLVGYVSREVEISDRTNISINLEPDFRSMNDVVVVGYGTQKKKDLTGSVGTVSGTELNKIAVASVDQALQGKLAGVMVTTNSGEPGGATTVRVRGIGGFGNSEPLYVIDGVIITYSSSDAYSNPLATLNMADIESINVLKDASASAIYGARAGNGVVLITTKRGKIGQARINAEVYYGVQSVTKKMDMMNAKEIAQFSNDSRTAAGLPIYGPFTNPESLGEGVDWQDQIYRKANMSNYQLSISGGNDKSQYFISGGYQKQDGIIKSSSFDRYSLRVNLDNQLTSWLKLGNNLTISRTLSNSPTNVGNNDKFDGIVAIALRRSPTLAIYNSDGTWAGTPSGAIAYLGNVSNPLRIATELNNPNERIRGLGNIFFDVKLMRDLTFRTSLGIDYVLINASQFQKQITEESVQDLSRSATSSKTTNSNILSENTLNYKKVFGKHSVDVLAGYTTQKATYENVYAYSENHLNDVLTTVDAGSSIGRLASGSKSIVSYVSYLARINYAFDGKYLLTANIRRDGASVFSSENKFAVFPSFSAGWRISNEKFMEHIPAISNLMLRGSWGQTGIDGSLGVGAEYASMGTGYLYNFNGVPINGMVQTSIPNSSLKWETVTQTDFGFDLGLFNNRINITADYFKKHFSDMIEQRPIPGYFGIWDSPSSVNSISQAMNGATIDNTGFEFSLNYDNQAPQDKFNYSLGVNLTTYSNKVVELASPTSGGAAGVNVIQGNLTRTEKGRSVGEFYGYIVDGIFQTKDEILKSPSQNANTAPGDYKFRDVNNDNKINENDKTFIGSPIPDIAYGITGNMSYKQFDLNFSLQGVSGNEIVNVNKFMTESVASTENKNRTMLNRWTASNPNATYARAISTDPNFNDRFSTRHVEDGSFFRLRNIQFGYKLPAHLINKISLSTVRIYISAQNLFTITNYSGYNPDIGSQKQSNASSGLDNTIYPQARSIIGGIQIGF
ncbi:SusC/RagA family TonB-linked outer membrane protein [Flavitalea sp.]|nr:TonB-dependent receptor [Flavitalea sp.]